MENNHQRKYYLELNLADDLAFQIERGTNISLEENTAFPNGLNLKVDSIEPIQKDALLTIRKHLNQLFSAVFIPLSNSVSRSKLFSLSFLYTMLIPSGVAVFFIRGWRFEIVKRMIASEPYQAIAPNVHSLNDLGIFIRDGIRLFGAKALYDLPKLLILVAIGYDHIEMIIDWIYYFFTKVPGMGDAQNFAATSAIKFSTTLLIQLAFFIIASFIITPAFKINMIKYATGKISFAGFFSLRELKDSFTLYRRYKTLTITTYLWDALVSGVSTILGFMLMVLFPFIFWLLIPIYKLLFKHWLKAYGYGILARRLIINGEI